MLALLMAGLIDGRSLGDAVVVTAPYYVGPLRQFEDPPYCIPNLDILHTIALSPDAEDIFAAPDTQDEAAELLPGIQELISNEC